MSRYLVTPPSLEAIAAAVQTAMDGGDGRVSPETLARVLAENEPAKYRRTETTEMSDETYAASFEARFGYSAGEAPAPTGEDEEYAAEFRARFGPAAAALAAQNATRWVDGSWQNAAHVPALAALLPEARFIHMIRDGRDVALSHMRMNWGPTTYAESAQLWVTRISKARRHAPNIDHYSELRFEDLVTDTEGTLRKVCAYIDLEYDPVMLDYHERAEKRLAEKAIDLPRKHGPTQTAEARMDSHRLAKEPPQADRLGMWRRKMTPAEIAEYEAIAGPLLEELGYELSA